MSLYNNIPTSLTIITYLLKKLYYISNILYNIIFKAIINNKKLKTKQKIKKQKLKR